MSQQDNKGNRRSPRQMLRDFYAPPRTPPPSRRAVLKSMLSTGLLGSLTPACSTSGSTHTDSHAPLPEGDADQPVATGGSSAEPTEQTEQTSLSAYDIVELGSTGIRTSRLAMGTGTNGYDGTSEQTRMGEDFVQMLVQGYERGIRFFETADAYGTHELVGRALSQVGRSNVTVLSKTMAQTREEAEADLARFLSELGTDYIDIVLLHIRTSPNWTTESAGAMDVLSESKARGQIRAHGVSCHSLEALRLATQTDWVDIDLARINPFGSRMDADPKTVLSELRAMRQRGKAVLGMKIFGGGENTEQFDEAIEHAARLDAIHAFTIGFTSIDQLDQVADKIATL